MEDLVLCCCCLLRPPDKDLNTPYVFLGVTEIFADLLEECFQIHCSFVGFDYKYGICEVCVGRLRDATDFKLQVQRSQAELQARLVRAQSVKEEELDPKTEVSDAGNDHPTEGNIIHEYPTLKTEKSDEDDSFAEDDFMPPVDSPALESESGLEYSLELAAPQQSSLTTHIRVPADQQSERTERRDLTSGGVGEAYTCDICGAHYAYKCGLTAHLNNHMMPHDSHKQSNKDIKLKSTNPGVGFVCDTCGDKFEKKCALASHLKVHTRLIDSQKKQTAKNRKVTSRLVGETYSCGLNKEKFKKKYLTIHQSTIKLIKIKGPKKKKEEVERDVVPYICKICSKVLKYRKYIEIHKRTCTPASLTCDVCNKQFSVKEYLSRHKRLTHPTGDKPFACEVCGKRYMKNCALKVHMRSHTGIKPYLCEVCSKSFSHSSLLSRHRMIHEDDKFFICDICKKRFNDKSTLITHIAIHTGWKYHPCQICHKKYSKKSELVLHIRTHTGEKPFECEFCGYKYSGLGALRRHVSHVHHNVRRYVCETCGRAFKAKEHLNSHQRVHVDSTTQLRVGGD